MAASVLAFFIKENVTIDERKSKKHLKNKKHFKNIMKIYIYIYIYIKEFTKSNNNGVLF